jgi:hypothetical protein
MGQPIGFRRLPAWRRLQGAGHPKQLTYFWICKSR